MLSCVNLESCGALRGSCGIENMTWMRDEAGDVKQDRLTGMDGWTDGQSLAHIMHQDG